MKSGNFDEAEADFRQVVSIYLNSISFNIDYKFL